MTQEQYQPMIGDRVSLEGEIVEIEPWGNVKINIAETVGWFHPSKFKSISLKLLSRKSPRKITRKEIEEMVGGSFEIVD